MQIKCVLMDTNPRYIYSLQNTQHDVAQHAGRREDAAEEGNAGPNVGRCDNGGGERDRGHCDVAAVEHAVPVVRPVLVDEGVPLCRSVDATGMLDAHCVGHIRMSSG